MSTPALNYTQQNKASLADAEKVTEVKDVIGPLDDYRLLKFKEVTTELDSGSFLLGPEEKFFFHNYFSDDCWIIAEVYKKPGAATFYLNELIEMQLKKAGVTKRNPRTVVLKNVHHGPIVNLRLVDGELDVTQTQAVTNSSLFKAIDLVVQGRILGMEKFGENHIRMSFSPLGRDKVARPETKA